MALGMAAGVIDRMFEVGLVAQPEAEEWCGSRSASSALKMEIPAKPGGGGPAASRKGLGWRWWLLVILFPIPFGPWWLTVISLAVFCLLLWLCSPTNKKPSRSPPERINW